MNDIEIEILNAMYDHCLAEFGKKKESSLWMLVVTSNSNTIKRAIKAASYSAENSSIMIDLEKKGYVQEFEPGSYSLTAEGILFIEKELRRGDDRELIDWVNKKLLMKTKTITDKNRVILLSLLACRSFSDDTSVSYAESDKESAFLSLLSDSNDFLLEHQIINNDIMKDSGKNRSKSTISKILDQIDKLPSSSGMIFKALGNKNYYLDVVKNQTIDRTSITLITKIVMGDAVNYDSLSELKLFCKESYVKYGYIFRSGNTSFEGPIVDFKIEAGIGDAML